MSQFGALVVGQADAEYGEAYLSRAEQYDALGENVLQTAGRAVSRFFQNIAEDINAPKARQNWTRSTYERERKALKKKLTRVAVRQKQRIAKVKALKAENRALKAELRDVKRQLAGRAQQQQPRRRPSTPKMRPSAPKVLVRRRQPRLPPPQRHYEPEAAEAPVVNSPGLDMLDPAEHFDAYLGAWGY